MNKRIFLSAPHMSGNELKYIEKVFEKALTLSKTLFGTPPIASFTSKSSHSIS